MRVRDVMTTDVEMVAYDTSLVEAAKVMRKQDIGFLPVVENGIVLGVVTDRDMVTRGIAEARNLHLTRVSDIMTPALIWCYADEVLTEAARILEPGGRLLIVGAATARAVQAMVRNDPVGFAEQELRERAAAGLPPALHAAVVEAPVGSDAAHDCAVTQGNVAHRHGVVVETGEHDHRHLGVTGAQAAEGVEPAAVGQREVEQHEVVARVLAEGVAGGAIDLGRATQGVGVLHAGIIFEMTLPDLTSINECEQLACDELLPGVRTRGMNARIKGSIRRAQRFDRHRGR